MARDGVTGNGPSAGWSAPMQTEAVQETIRRHGAAVHSLTQRLVGAGPAAEEVACEVVRHLASPERASPRRRPAGDVPPEHLAAQSIALAYFGHRTYREIAGALGVPPELVKASIREGLRTLWDADSSVGGPGGRVGAALEAVRC